MLLPILLACTGGPTLVQPEGTIVLDLVNPTPTDAFSGVDEISIELRVGGVVVASETFGVDEPAEIPGLDAFGTGRFHVAGLSGGTVISYGRSPEILLGPDQDHNVAITFLPVNQVLSIADSMAEPRSQHGAVRLPDNRILLLGGANPNRDASYDDVEIYDPSEGIFKPTGTYLPLSLYDVELSFSTDRTIWLNGGRTLLSEGPKVQAIFFEYDPVTEQIEMAADMNVSRAGHCFHEFRDGFGAAMGGNRDTPAIDYLRPDPDTGEWTWSEVVISGLDQTAMTGCAALPTGEVFVQGLSDDSTGLFDFSEDAAAANPNISDAFYAVESGTYELLDGAMLIPVSDEQVWVGGGRTIGGVSDTTGRIFDVPTRSFVGGVDPSRERVDGQWDEWIEDGWYALGCGSPDGDNSRSQTTIELINLLSGERYSYVEGDRSRPGCELTVQADGAILITGGFESGGDAEASAAVMVPYNPQE
ncbi:MAG TPA: kelch repeat-containing protein [Myxococcota bacterium]|nr:kelch repeat-containing protein [Myxococcota bacterium]